MCLIRLEMLLAAASINDTVYLSVGEKPDGV